MDCSCLKPSEAECTRKNKAGLSERLMLKLATDFSHGSLPCLVVHILRLRSCNYLDLIVSCKVIRLET